MRTSMMIGILWIGTAAVLSSCSEKATTPPTPAAGPQAQHAAADPRRAQVTQVLIDPANSVARVAAPARGQTDAAPVTPLAVDDTAAEWADGLHEEQDRAWRSQSAARIWAEWDNVLSRANQREIGMMTAALGDSLRAPGATAVYSRIKARLQDPHTSERELGSLIEVLQYAATPGSMEALLAYLDRNAAASDGGNDDGAPTATRAQARSAVGAVAGRADPGGPNWAVSPVLEDAWRNLQPTRATEDLWAIGHGLATVGSPSGVTALLERAGDAAVADTPLQEVAYKSIAQVSSIDAIPALQAALARPDQAPRLRESVRDALISIGAADAGNALVNDLAAAPQLSDEQLEQLRTAMTSRGFPEESLKVFDEALTSGQIQDERVRDLLMSVIATPAESATAVGPATGTGTGKRGG